MNSIPPDGQSADADSAQPPASWPPAPTYAQPEPVVLANVSAYRSPRPLSIALAVFLSLMIVWAVGCVLLPATNHDLLTLGVLGTEVTGILFMAWTYRTYRNIVEFGCLGLRSSPGWAAAYYAMPILNIWMPAVIVWEIWKASDPKVLDPARRAWRNAAANPLIAIWWIVFQSYFGVLGLEHNDRAIPPDPLTIRVLGTTCILAATIAMMVTARISARQDAKAKALRTFN